MRRPLLEQDDPETERLRKQIREDLGTFPAGKRGRSPASIIFSTICLLSPFALYLVFVWNSHGFKNAGEFFHWLMNCISSKCT